MHSVLWKGEINTFCACEQSGAKVTEFSSPTSGLHFFLSPISRIIRSKVQTS